MPVSARKATGSFFTPIDLARVLARWAIRSPSDRVLEPSCGDGVFLLAAIERFRDLDASPECVREALWAVEKNSKPILTGPEVGDLDVRQWFEQLIPRDFFEIATPDTELFAGAEVPKCDVVLGNPPYVRYQVFAGATRERALARARERGVLLPGLASMWAPFLVHAAAFVNPNGRLAMVLPGELLHVQYAGAIRAFLLREFARVCVVKFEKKVFPGALEEVVLLLADRTSDEPGLHVAQVRDLEDLKNQFHAVIRGRGHAGADPTEKWGKYLLDKKAYAVFQSVATPNRFQPLREIASVDVGAVTGANKFFFLSPEEAERRGIRERYLKPAVSKAIHVSGCLLDRAAWNRLQEQEARCQLLLIDEEAVSAEEALRKYVRYGEGLGLHRRYKCRIRSPWFALRQLPVPDAFLTYMVNELPKLAYNEAKALNSNTIHSVRFRSRDEDWMKAHIASIYNSVTLLSCELFARSYGGGVLKLEPTEAEELLIPRLEEGNLLRKLSALFPTIDSLIREGRAEEAIARIDSVVLRRAFRVSPTRMGTVADSLHTLRSRRLARSIG